MSDANPTMLDLLISHRSAVDAFNAFSSIHPVDDDLHPLIELLSDNLRTSFLAIYPQLCGLIPSNAESRGPAGEPVGSDSVIDGTP